MPTVQYAVTAVVVALAVAYAAYRVWLAVKKAHDPCWGCSGCELKKQMQHARCDMASRLEKRPKTCPAKEKLHENLAE
ncbi:MAG: FeoB-associated Cys-rich membrane protein [Prevotella sp.]|nr:FeoB-associated Cys-rich membrane protein [Prevotella sp.]